MDAESVGGRSLTDAGPRKALCVICRRTWKMLSPAGRKRIRSAFFPLQVCLPVVRK